MGHSGEKGLASGNDRWVTKALREKADIDEEEAEAKKDNEITERIFASGDKDAMLARFKELKKYGSETGSAETGQEFSPARSREAPKYG